LYDFYQRGSGLRSWALSFTWGESREQENKSIFHLSFSMIFHFSFVIFSRCPGSHHIHGSNSGGINRRVPAQACFQWQMTNVK
jgi:hypothetical protein